MEPTRDPECAAVRDDLASLAIGALTGVDRARVLAHLEGCASCTADVEELAAAADALIALVPDAAPPEGFADRTVELIRADRAPRRSALRRAAAVAAVAILLAVGAGVGAVASSSGTTAPASAVRTAPLRSSVGTKGTVLLVSQGHQAWLIMALHDAPVSGLVSCSITLDRGARQEVGSFGLTDGYGSWSVVLPVAASTVRSVRVADATGAMIASAQLH